MPRIEEMIIITEYSPWCTIIKNPQGVTLGDICTTVFKECVPTVMRSRLSVLIRATAIRRRW